MKIITLFNNKGGVGKTTLVYHLAWMFNHEGYNVLAADLDPQCNLTAAFLSEKQTEENENTIYSAISPVMKGKGDIKSFEPIEPEKKFDLNQKSVWLIPGDLRLSLFEDELTHCWQTATNEDNERQLRVLSALYRTIVLIAENKNVDIILVDVGPNLGSLNRSALLSSDYVITPLTPDRYSLLGLDNLGDRLIAWRKQWTERLEKNSSKELEPELPKGAMEPMGYIVMQHSERIGRPVKSYHRWIERIPQKFHSMILCDGNESIFEPENDPFCLAHIKHYRSLIAMAMEQRKPIFDLTSADGAFGAHHYAVSDCRTDFRKLVLRILERVNTAAK